MLFCWRKGGEQFILFNIIKGLFFYVSIFLLLLPHSIFAFLKFILTYFCCCFSFTILQNAQKLLKMFILRYIGIANFVSSVDRPQHKKRKNEQQKKKIEKKAHTKKVVMMLIFSIIAINANGN